jgi:tetratricopeptide (TPR) repeat protein
MRRAVLVIAALASVPLVPALALSPPGAVAPHSARLLMAAETDSSPGASAAELERRGDEARALKNYLGADAYYRQALEKTFFRPQKAVLLNKLGIAALHLQRLDNARKLFEQALKNDGRLAEARNNLGAAYYLQKRYGKAVAQYQMALRLEDNASFHNNLATAYFMRQQYNLALLEYRRACELDPDIFERNAKTGVAAQMTTPERRAEYSFLLAKLFAQMGNLDRSLEYLRKAMEDGYPEIKSVYKDEAFAALRADPRFAALMQNPPPAVPE